ncbi:MAG: acyl-CoA dehydrogenase family protein [Burkholderiales bacterium]|nr:acyl-CoA dehydrogenase family protein [Burkholderiales bacterium]
MITDLDDTRAALRDSLARYLAERVDPGTQARADLPPPAPLWRGLAQDLGLLGAGFPEDAGGLGGGLAEHLLILQTLGGALAAEPYLSSALIAGGVLQRCGGEAARALLAQLIEGDALLAWAHGEPGQRSGMQAVASTLERTTDGWRLHGRKRAVQGAPWATHLLVTAQQGGEPALMLVPAETPRLVRRDLRGLDGGWASEIQFDGVVLPDAAVLLSGPAARAGIERALDEAALGACAEALGLMRRLLDDTIAHARERRQFGAPLASFQVLQHRIADMHIAYVQAEALTWSLADTMDAPAPERMGAVSAAKVTVGRALRCVGQGAVQIHGAMGVTEELAVGRCFRRATQLERLFGSTEQHLLRIAALQRGA